MIPPPGHKLGTTYDLAASRSNATPQVPAVHQTEALTRLSAWFQQAHTPYAGTILVLPTGGGKTFTAVQFLCSPTGPLAQNYKVLWLAHTHHLLEQAYESFQAGVGQLAARRTTVTARVVSGTIGHYRVADIRPTDDVVIATLPAITRAYNTSNRRHPALEAFLYASGGRLLVVFDEAHHAPAYSYRTLLTTLRQAHPQLYLLGLTATPTYTDDRKRGWLRDLFPQNICYQVTPQVLMAQQILAEPIIEQHSTQIAPQFTAHEYQKWLGSHRDIPEQIITQLAERRDRNQHIAQTYIQHRERYGKTIIFADRWFQCEQLKAFLEEAARAAHTTVRVGTVYAHVDADPGHADLRNVRTADENKQTLAQFRRGELDVLINVRMLTEGTDVPDVQTIFLTRQTTSQILLTQMVGRGLRGPKFGGTAQAYLVSFIDHWEHLITWAAYQPLAEGGTFADAPAPVVRPPLHLLPIHLIESLSRTMYGDDARAMPPFLTLLPVGWYLVEFEPLASAALEEPHGNGNHPGPVPDDREPVRQFVLVFEHEQSAYVQLIEGLKIADLSELADGEPETQQQRLAGWHQHSFGSLPPPIGGDTRANIFLIARHMAQNEQQPPPFFPFREREQHDLDALARIAITQDLGLKTDDQRLRLEYDRKDRYWQACYAHYDQFKAHYDACLRRIIAADQSDQAPPIAVPLPTTPANADEPAEQVKQAVRQRDRHGCRCCGASTRLQVDHIQPRYYGGGHEESNLQTLCQTCHTIKGLEKISFLAHTSPLDSPPASFAILAWPANAPIEERERISLIRRNVNFFYRCAAVQSVDITSDRICHIVLHKGNHPAWFRSYLDALREGVCQGQPIGVARIREIRLSVAGAPPTPARIPDSTTIQTDVVLILRTAKGAIRRVPLDSTGSTRVDEGTAIGVAYRTDTVLLISDQGNGYVRTVAQLPTGSPSSAPTSLHPYWHLRPNEQLVAALALPERARPDYLVLLTRTGHIKRLPLAPISAAGLERSPLQVPHPVSDATSMQGKEDLILVSRRGTMIRIPETNVPVLTDRTDGLPVRHVPPHDEIVALTAAGSAAQLLRVTTSGKVMLTHPGDIPPRHRTNTEACVRGAVDPDDAVIAAHAVMPADHLLVITSTNQGKLLPIARLEQHARRPSGYQIPELYPDERLVTALVLRGGMRTPVAE